MTVHHTVRQVSAGVGVLAFGAVAAVKDRLDFYQRTQREQELAVAAATAAGAT